MFGGSMAKGAGVRVAATGGLALALVLAACSSDDGEAKAAPRRCEVVSAGDLSDLVGSDMALEAVGKNRATCRYVSDDERIEVRLTIEGPVEAGQAALSMTTPKAVAKLGDEAWVTNQNAPLDTQLVMRKGGTLLQVDLADESRTPKDRIALATSIARAGVARVPVMKVKQPTGPRGEAACKPFETDAVEELMGGVVVVTPSAPVGSCRLTAAALNRSVDVSVLVESGATQAQLDAFVSNVDSESPVKVGEDPGYWIPSPAGESNGGQLDLLDSGRIVQVAVIGVEFPAGEAQALATSIAEIAVAPR